MGGATLVVGGGCVVGWVAVDGGWEVVGVATVVGGGSVGHGAVTHTCTDVGRSCPEQKEASTTLPSLIRHPTIRSTSPIPHVTEHWWWDDEQK